MFSSRLPSHLTVNAVSQRVAERRRRGEPLIDLTVSNPTQVGLVYPPDLLAPLADPRGVIYAPEPLGVMSARQAVAESLQTPAVTPMADRVVLTASSSESYAVLFKLLCDAGDDVLIPVPSYPLFELLTNLDNVTARTYRFDNHGVWSIDRESVIRASSARTRAILVVSPNNPTGSMLRTDDREWLIRIAAERGWAVISDEVFADYPLEPRSDATSMLGEAGALTFVLGGLSKSAGLPQAKLGWIVVDGPETEVGTALERLELICDTYLSVSTPVQLALPALIERGRDVRRQIRERVAINYTMLKTLVNSHPSVRVCPVEGGWSAVVQVPATTDEESLVLRLIEEAGVLVQPGYFFDFDFGVHLVVSLLTESLPFEKGVTRMLEVAR